MVEWGHQQTELTIFLSSPSDVKEERNSVSKVVEEVNDTLPQNLGIRLRVERWEKFRPSKETFDQFIERHLIQSDLFVMIFSRKFGSPPTRGGKYESGTEMEYDIACKLNELSDGKRPELFTYFSKIEDPLLIEDPGEELKKVLNFKEKVKQSLFYKEYPSSEVFHFYFKDHLISWVLEISERMKEYQSLVKKKTTLENFFALGSPPGEPTKTLIIYAPNEFAGDRTHLLPYMVTEDFIAIHKLTKSLNIAGHQDVRAITTDVYDPDRDRGYNKIFVCLPRNMRGRHCLKRISSTQKEVFQIEPIRQDEKMTWLINWFNQNGLVKIHSPQSRYLIEQRESDAWKSHPANCVARDYGVIARFFNPRVQDDPTLGSLKKLFVFGIRGLGTWGAAHYLDHSWKDLHKGVKNKNSIQILLEITYCDGRVRSVEDVSNNDQQYFDEQMEGDYIREEIKRWRDKV